MIALGFLLLVIGFLTFRLQEWRPYLTKAAIFAGLCMMIGLIAFLAGVTLWLWRVAP